MVMLATSSAPGTSALMVSGMAASSAPDAVCTVTIGRSGVPVTSMLTVAVAVPPRPSDTW